MKTFEQRTETLCAAVGQHPLLVLHALRFIVNSGRCPPTPLNRTALRALLSHVAWPLFDSGYDSITGRDNLRKAAQMLKGTSVPIRRSQVEDDDPAQDRS